MRRPVLSGHRIALASVLGCALSLAACTRFAPIEPWELDAGADDAGRVDDGGTNDDAGPTDGGGCVPANDGLLLHFDFEEPEGARVVDRSCSGRDGILYGGTRVDAGGSRAIELAVDDEVRVGSGLPLGPEGYTVYVRLSTSFDVAGTDALLTNDPGTNDWAVMIGAPPFGGVSLTHADATYDATTQVSPVAVADGSFHDVTVTYRQAGAAADAAELEGYVDREPPTTTPLSCCFPPPPAVSELVIQGLAGAPTVQIDELRIYDRVLSASEISALH